VSIVQIADTKVIKYLNLVINKLKNTRRGILTKISAGQPIVTAISPYKSITFHIQKRFGINPVVPMVWTGSGYGSVSVIIKRYKAVKKMLQGGWVHYICLSKRCKSNEYAFVDSPRYFIYLCRLFWTSCPPSCRALTLIHEALHIYFWPFLGDTGALANAYSYENFIKDIVFSKLFPNYLKLSIDLYLG